MIYDILPVNNYLGNNSATLFEFDFLIDDSSQLAVYLFDEDGSKHKLIQDIDYSVENIQNQHGGHIIFPISGSKYNILNDRQKISLELDIPTSQETQYNNSSLLNLSAIEYSFDYLTRLVQIIKRKLSLCVKVEECSENTPQDLLDSINNSAIETKNNAQNSAKILSEIKNETNKILNHSYFTNSLLEIPQRIKYTLENNIFTVKAGTVLIVPYGVEDLTPQYPKGAAFLNENFKVVDTQFDNNLFFVWVELQNDLTNSVATTDSNDRILYLSLNDSQIRAQVYFGSGTQEYDEEKSSVWYRTDENIVKRYSSGVLTSSVCCLPIGFCKADGVHIVGSIEQVFNGIGYIGSTLWVDKGVKGLISNGRNEDGTLNNIVHTNDDLKVFSAYTANAPYIMAVLPTDKNLGVQQIKNYYYLDSPSLPNVGTSSSKAYIESENFWYESNSSTDYTWKKVEQFVVGNVTWTDGIITFFNPKLPFRAVSFSDSSKVSSWPMPSDKYIDLTLGASGSSYTAPANGWVYLWKQAANSGQYIRLLNTLKSYGLIQYAPSSGAGLQLLLPVCKSDVVSITYTAANATETFRFIYAQGEV